MMMSSKVHLTLRRLLMLINQLKIKEESAKIKKEARMETVRRILDSKSNLREQRVRNITISFIKNDFD
jgi:hypothetical protein